ncbi:epimerase [Microlunatus endophyticus]|uniref:Epimerase n=2 Tax=Microlunatus endophyticus TaxID=1716077 RepID=A0A917SJD7_9ACTN|nr:epimerase [Microlunatus endophyticus]
MQKPDDLDRILKDSDAVIHIAGVNRADSDAEVENGNTTAAECLAGALVRRRKPVPVVYANSIQSTTSSPYGRGKAAAARILKTACDGQLANILLPNLFGEHGRPRYNSFVATFADLIAHDQEPVVHQDREVPLLHVQQAARTLIDIALGGESGDRTLEGDPHTVTEVLDLLRRMHALYSNGEIPPLPTPFDSDLFNTYRSYRFPDMFPHTPKVHADQRGDLFEAVRSHGGTGQAFVSSTRPGAQRGDHYHIHKFERFLVIQGEAEIKLRRLLHDDIVTFRVSGSTPSFVDMPTLWVHNIRNVGDDEVLTMFWSDQLLDRANPDQYPEAVESKRSPSGSVDG